MRTVLFAGIAASAASPASAVDFRITDTAWGAIDNDLWGSYAFGRADDKGFFARGTTTTALNYRLFDGTTLGGSATFEYFSKRDINVDNIGDEADANLYTAIVYATAFGATFSTARLTAR